jgi:hypothetical protein
MSISLTNLQNAQDANLKKMEQKDALLFRQYFS